MPRRDMDRSSPRIHRDKLRAKNHRAPWEQWMLRPETLELCAWECLDRLTGGLEPSRETKGVDQFVCEHENFRHPLAPKFLHDVDLFWINCDYEVRRQRPGCCRPDRDTRFPGELPSGNRELDENGLVIAFLIFYLGLGQGSLRPCAPKDRLFRLVNQSLLDEGGNDAQNLPLIGGIHCEIRISPVTENAQALELLTLDIDESPGKCFASFPNLKRRQTA